ncbi:TetR/AcrR family transcriptional regulator [Bacillaceae bacterium CLA-AA-H227]|uniref:TetR/AcrR family transcriptional regulator n=1 Tax=Robertmurraya yapensis (ex Hitch et al 2024) TaxID=3133160 RepID=A0ACC6S6V4_9BACI
MRPMERYDLEIHNNRKKRSEAILDAAEYLFAKNGIENTTMQEIADSTNIGVATVFRFFPRKEKIIVEIATKNLRDVLRVFQEISALQVTCLEKVEKLLEHFLTMLRSEHDDTIKMLENFDTYTSRLKEPLEGIDQFKTIYREISNVFSGIIEEGITDGTIRSDINIKETLITLINTVGLFARKLSIQKSILFIHLDLEPERQLEILKNIVLEYLTNSVRK